MRTCFFSASRGLFATCFSSQIWTKKEGLYSLTIHSYLTILDHLTSARVGISFSNLLNLKVTTWTIICNRIVKQKTRPLVYESAMACRVSQVSRPTYLFLPENPLFFITSLSFCPYSLKIYCRLTKNCHVAPSLWIPKNWPMLILKYAPTSSVHVLCPCYQSSFRW